MRKSRKKFSWSYLFGNNRFVLIFSIVFSFCLWMIMMYNNTDANQTWKIDGIPVTVEYTSGAVEAGYKVYNLNKSTVSVSIAGNSLSIRQIKAENIEVVATITDSAKKGENTISLTARKKSGVISDFKVASVDPGTISAYIDVSKEKVFNIDSNINASVAENYYMKPPQFENETVTLNGPEADLAKVAKVAAEFSFDSPINETKEFVANLVMYDDEGKPIKNDYISMTQNTVKVKIPVLWQQSVSLQTTFPNIPSQFSRKLITVNPESVMFAGQKDSFKNLSSITLSPVDFSKINLSSTSFSVNIVTPDGFTNIGNENTAKINFNLYGYVEKWIVVSDITFVNVPVNKSAELYNSSVSVMVVGPSDAVNALSSSDLSAQISLSNVSNVGTTDLPMNVSIINNSTCWVYGSYKTTVNVKNS